MQDKRFFVFLHLNSKIKRKMKHAFRHLLLMLMLALTVGAEAQVNKWRDIYKVKKKDTVFGIAKKFDLSLPELMEANPAMKQEGYMLKKGDTLFIPYADPKKPDTPTKPAAQNGPATNSPRTATTQRTVRVGVMLPLHDVDGDGRRMVEYYRGVLMACDDLKRQGISTDIHAWNVAIDSDIRQTLLHEGANRCDIIFGPLYTKQVPFLAEFCKAYDIKLVIPFSIEGDAVDRVKQVYQVYQSPERLNNAAIQAYLNRFPTAHPVFVDCNDTTSRKGIFTFGLRKELDRRGTKYSITNVNSSEELFLKAFDRSRQNVVIVNTGRSPELNAVLAKLDAMTQHYPGLVISLYGYTEWLMYARYNMDRFFKYDTYIPSTFYYNTSSAKTIELERDYQKWFGKPMMYALPHFAITGYDHAMFFIKGLHDKGKAFNGEAGQSNYVPLQTPLNFKRSGRGGFRNENFQLIHYAYNHQIESIKF